MDKKIVPTVSKKQLIKVSDVSVSTASRVKFLADENFSRADISRIMTAHSGKSVSYQWVKNVLDKRTV